MRNYPATLDDQFAWFHKLAERLQDQDKAALDEARELLPRFVSDHLPGTMFPHDMERSAFKQAVADLRSNERAWNRELQAAIIEADEQANAAGPNAAKMLLQRFVRQCPWKHVCEVARNQAGAYGSAL